MLSREQILEQLLALPTADQAFLADMLEQKLATGQFGLPVIADAWSQEIDRRIAAHDRGEVTAIDFDKSLDSLRQAILEHRSRPVTS